MTRTRDNTRLEVWDADYINRTRERKAEDANAQVIQIEHVEGNAYMVEVLDECPEV